MLIWTEGLHVVFSLQVLHNAVDDEKRKHEFNCVRDEESKEAE